MVLIFESCNEVYTRLIKIRRININMRKFFDEKYICNYKCYMYLCLYLMLLLSDLFDCSRSRQFCPEYIIMGGVNIFVFCYIYVGNTKSFSLFTDLYILIYIVNVLYNDRLTSSSCYLYNI